MSQMCHMAHLQVPLPGQHQGCSANARHVSILYLLVVCMDGKVANGWGARRRQYIAVYIYGWLVDWLIDILGWRKRNRKRAGRWCARKREDDRTEIFLWDPEPPLEVFSPLCGGFSSAEAQEDAMAENTIVAIQVLWWSWSHDQLRIGLPTMPFLE